MKINFFAPVVPRPWDWSDLESGMGGSETAVIELSRRLAKRGHRVTVYTRTKHDTANDVVSPKLHLSPVHWKPLQDADLAQSGLWILCRCPQALDLFHGRRDQTVWLRCDDPHYEQDGELPVLSPERASKANRVIAMSPIHREAMLGFYPFLDPERVAVCEPGIDSARIGTLEPRERDPFRLIWTSSPDRGLANCIKILQRAREFEPRLNLSVTYGWQNFDASSKGDLNHPAARMKAAILAMDLEGVTFAGLLSRQKLLELYQESSFWVYPSAHFETACVSAMEAQALGCIPITNPWGALTQNVRHGAFVMGDPSHPLTQAHYWKVLLGLVHDKEAQEKIRGEMMAQALTDFDWERGVDQHEELMSCRQLEAVAG